MDPAGNGQTQGMQNTGGNAGLTGAQPVGAGGVQAQPPGAQPVQPVAGAIPMQEGVIPTQPGGVPMQTQAQPVVNTGMQQPQGGGMVTQPPVQTQPMPAAQPQPGMPAPTQPQPVPVAPVAAQPPQSAVAPAPVAASPAPAVPAGGQPGAQDPKKFAAITGEPINLAGITTKSGKTMADFQIPEDLIQDDPQIVDLVLRSESMNDGERQYWFNLTEIMSSDQVEKLRDILSRERKKLAEIEAKYGKPKVQLSPEEVARRNAELEQKRAEQQQRLAQREQKHQQEEAEKEAAILAELEGL